MADKLTLHGATDIRKHAGTDIHRVNPKRGGSTHQIRQWWSMNAKNIAYVECLVFLVDRGDGALKLAVPITDSTRLTIAYDGADDFTFSGILDVDRIGVFDASDFSLCQEYLLPHIVGGKQLKRTVNALPGPPPGPPQPVVTTIGTVTITKSGGTASGAATEVDLQYSFSISGDATTGTTNNWRCSAPGVLIDDAAAVSTKITLPVGGPYTISCTVTNPNSSDSPVTETSIVTVT